eukprot:4287305-Amphidinium_carterae.2
MLPAKTVLAGDWGWEFPFSAIRSCLLEETNSEVERGWAAGPFSKRELDDMFGCGNWISAKRFPIEQSSAGVHKVRFIETTTPNMMSGSCTSCGIPRILDESDVMGHRWHCRDHLDWMSSSAKMVARTVDLRSACKQLPSQCVIYHWRLHACTIKSFSMPNLTAPSAAKLAESVLDLLGWEFDSRGHKYKDFADNMDVLGTSIAIGKTGFAIANTKNQTEGMKLVLDDLLRSRTQGTTFTLGHPDGVRQSDTAREDPEMAYDCLILFREYLECAKPRVVSFSSSLAPLVLYTDGAAEQGVATAGVLLHIPGQPHH